MPAICAAEATEGPVRAAERGDRGRRQGGAEDPADLLPACVASPDQGGEDRTFQREEESADDAAQQGHPAEAGSIPQREAPETAGRRGGEEGDGRQGSVHEHAEEGNGTDAGASQGQGGRVRGLLQAKEAEPGVPGGAEQVHVVKSQDREER
jgi:hypothetical protein